MGVYITGVTLEEMLDPHKHSTLFSALSLDGEEPVLIATRRGIKLIEVKTPHGKLVDVNYLFVKLQEALQDEEDTRTAKDAES